MNPANDNGDFDLYSAPPPLSKTGSKTLIRRSRILAF